MKHLYYTFVVAIVLIASGVVFNSCTNDDVFPSGKEGLELAVNFDIVHSLEMEEFIFAGADLFQAKAAFTEALNSIDFSQLEVTYDENGRRITRLPADITSIGIERKVQTLNETRSALHQRFPQLASFGEEASRDHFTRAARRLTVPVHSAPQLIRSAPRLRSGRENDDNGNNGNNGNHRNNVCIIASYDTFEQMLNKVNEWMNHTCRPKELIIVAFKDGTFVTHLHYRATPERTYPTIVRCFRTGYLYYNRGDDSYGRISWMGHTHYRGYGDNPGYEPSRHDKAFRDTFPQIVHKIFYDGRFHEF